MNRLVTSIYFPPFVLIKNNGTLGFKVKFRQKRARKALIKSHRIWLAFNVKRKYDEESNWGHKAMSVSHVFERTRDMTVGIASDFVFDGENFL